MLITIQQWTLPCENLNDGTYTLRFWYNQGFLDSSGQAVAPGTATTGTQIRSVATVSGGFITFDPVPLYSTLDAEVPAPQSIQIACQLFRGNTALPIFPFQQIGTPPFWIIPDDLGATISFEEWTIVNQRIVLANPPQTFYTAAEVDALIEANNTQVAFNQDYVISAYASLAAAVAAVAITDGTLVINESTSCPSNLTVPNNVTLRFTRKGSIVMTSGRTLKILSPIDADSTQQIFFNATGGSGRVVFFDTSTNPDVYPGVEVWVDWWQFNTTPDTTDMALAIEAADASVCSGALDPVDGVTIASQGVVRFNTAIYRVNSALTFRGAPWKGEGVNNTVINSYGSSGATVTAAGTNTLRRELNIEGIYFYGGNSSGTAYGIDLGFNMRSYRALVDVKISHYPSYGIFFSAHTTDMAFYNTQVVSCGGTAGFSGIAIDSSVSEVNDIDWYGLRLENNGKAASGKGGGIDTQGGTSIHQWSIFGGLLQSNKGAGEIYIKGGSNFSLFGMYTESEPTVNVLTAYTFENVLNAGIHDCYFTGSANTGSALKFIDSNGVIDNIRSFANWTTAITLTLASNVQIGSLGSLVQGTAPVSVAATAILNWPIKNKDGIVIGLQVAPATLTGAATITAAQLFTGLIEATPPNGGGNVAYTLPSGTLMEAVAPFSNTDYFDWSIINLASLAGDTGTITAAVDHTLRGVGVVQSSHATTGGLYGNAARFRSKRITPTVWVTYRLA